ncbi:MAG: hypothetical protein CME15_13100 [Gemmatimonadetes bacterium]|jgi:hypothetical protein|nr:hypothetical protein [Gemmatimonadota bacterium]
MLHNAETMRSMAYTNTSSERLRARLPPLRATGIFIIAETTMKVEKMRPGEYGSSCSKGA